jgi:hypothetical protein
VENGEGFGERPKRKLPYFYEDLKYVLELVSREKNLKVNLKALELGFQEGKLLKT